MIGHHCQDRPIEHGKANLQRSAGNDDGTESIPDTLWTFKTSKCRNGVRWSNDSGTGKEVKSVEGTFP